MKSGLSRPDHWDRKTRPQCVETRVAHGVDADRVKALFLGAHPGFEDDRVHDKEVVVAVGEGHQTLRTDELDVELGADEFAGNLGLDQLPSVLGEGHRKDDLDSLFSTCAHGRPLRRASAHSTLQ